MTDENQADENVVDQSVETEVDEVSTDVENEQVDDVETVEAEPKPSNDEIINSDDDEIIGEVLGLIHGNLTNAFIEEIRNMPHIWDKTGEDGQDEIIERCRNRAEHHIRSIAAAILGRKYEKCTAIVDTVTHKDECKVVLKTHDVEGGLMFAQRAGGQSVVVVFTDDKDYLNGGGMPEKDKRQRDMLEDVEIEKDALYQQCLDLVIAEGKVSLDLLQREIKIGYNRAARIIEMMESEGVVSAPDESGQRTVLDVDEPGEVVSETDEIVPMLHRPGKYDLIVDEQVETSIEANDLEDATSNLGYTEFEIQDQGTENEYAIIIDDERVQDDGVVVKIQFSENQASA